MAAARRGPLPGARAAAPPRSRRSPTSRHHDLDLGWRPSGAPGFASRVTRVHAVGPRLRVELSRLDGSGALEAELPRQSSADQTPRVGDELFARPRQIRAFAAGHEVALAPGSPALDDRQPAIADAVGGGRAPLASIAQPAGSP